VIVDNCSSVLICDVMVTRRWRCIQTLLTANQRWVTRTVCACSINCSSTAVARADSKGNDVQ
jgi:hypothetical protein